MRGKARQGTRGHLRRLFGAFAVVAVLVTPSWGDVDLECEDATLTGVSAKAHAGASGGYRVINWSEAGDAAFFPSVPSGSGITVTYSLARENHRSLSLYVGGRHVGDLHFFPTGSWDTYQSTTLITDIAGSVTLRIDANDFGANLPDRACASIDRITIHTDPVTTSTYAFQGADGRMHYHEDALGNRIPDYSRVGYSGGGMRLPGPEMVPVRAILYPEVSGDDTDRIQAAIDAVGVLHPDDRGFRGAVYLTTGTYRVEGTLVLNDDGVVLRGAGQGTDGTVLIATGTTQRTLVRVSGGGGHTYVDGTRKDIVDDYVPVGATSFRVSDTDGLVVGDRIVVERPSTAEWIHEIEMDDIPPRPDTGIASPWEPGTMNILFSRVIMAIDGDRITVDVPLCNAFEREYGGGTIWKYTDGRVRNVGVEFIRSESEYVSETDEAHGWTFVQFYGARNGWARNLTSVYYGFGCVFLSSYSEWITVENCSWLDGKSIITGSRRYPFDIAGEQNLVANCYAREARHEFAMSSRVPGPNAFVYGASHTSHNDTGPHFKWSAGVVWDNLYIFDGQINIQNREWYGLGHGWAGANQTVWNSVAGSMAIQSPQTAQNWSIGNRCTKSAGSFPPQPDGIWDSHNQPVGPTSLYEAQRDERLDRSLPGVVVFSETWDSVTAPLLPTSFAGASSGVVSGSDELWTWQTETAAVTNCGFESGETGLAAARLTSGTAQGNFVLKASLAPIDLDDVTTLSFAARVRIGDLGDESARRITIALRNTADPSHRYEIELDADTDEAGFAIRSFDAGTTATPIAGSPWSLHPFELGGALSYTVQAILVPNGDTSDFTFRLFREDTGALAWWGTERFDRTPQAALDELIVTFEQNAPGLIDDIEIRTNPCPSGAPSFTSNPMTRADATEDVSYSATIAGSASDPTGQALTYSKLTGAAWLQVAPDGALSGTPENDDVGEHEFVVQVADTDGLTHWAYLHITVLNTNDAPIFSRNPIDFHYAVADCAYNATAMGEAEDVDAGDVVTYSKTAGAAWLTVRSDGRLRGTPGGGDVGENAFTIRATDMAGAWDEATLRIEVITEAPVLYVDANATGADDGRNWDDAFPTLEGALETIPTTAGLTEVWVAQGIYTAPISFDLPSRANVYGGFAGGETERSERDPVARTTILTTVRSGQTDSRIVSIAGDASDVRLDGFVLTGSSAPNGYGAGVFCGAGVDGLMVARCVFVDNQAKYGAAMHMVGASTVSLERCAIVGNRVGHEAPDSVSGTVRGERGTNLRVANSVFSGNYSVGTNHINGTGISLVEGETDVLNCTFYANDSGGRGAALIVWDSQALLRNCILKDNLSALDYNPLHDKSWGGSTILSENCIHHGNTPERTNSVTYSGRINDDPLFSAAPWGTWASVTSSTVVTTMTVSGGGLTPGALAGLFINPNTAQTRHTVILSNGSDSIAVVGKGLGAGAGTSFQVIDLHPQSGSPAIDAGVTDESAAEDYDGNPRPLDGDTNGSYLWDIGAYEIGDPAQPTRTPTPTPTVTPTPTATPTSVPASAFPSAWGVF